MILARLHGGIGLALLTLLACDDASPGERVGEAASALVSPSTVVASLPSAPSLAVSWNCGVGLVAWIGAGGTEIRGVRFDDEGVALDASPILIATTPSGFGAVDIKMERAVDGFQVLVKTVGGFPLQRRGTAYGVGVDGLVGPSTDLGGAIDSTSGFDPSAYNIVGSGFDGTSTFVAISSGTDPGASQPTPTMDVYLRKIGAGSIAGDSGIPGPLGTQKDAAFRGFGCGPSGCLLMTIAPSATGSDYVDRRIVNASVVAVATHPSTVVPNTGFGDVVASECGFLVLSPSSSRLVDPTPALNAGPVALPGSALSTTPYEGLVDGTSARVYWVEGGLQSIEIDSAAQPAAPLAEDGNYAQTTLDIAPVGNGRAVQAYYEGSGIQVRFLGDNALVPTAGECNTAPLPAITGAACPPSIGDGCSNDSECITGFCVDDVCCSTACDGECDACSVAAGAAADGTCGPLTGPTCDDGDSCSQSSTCVAGACVGNNPVADGTICDDVSVCSDTSLCQAGVCVAGAPAPDGTSCPNLDPCSPSSECQAGACVGVTACLPLNECLIPVCDAATGNCNQIAKPLGSPCGDDLCVYSFCNLGFCDGPPVKCGGPFPECHVAPECDPATGDCVSAPAPDGSPCVDGICIGGVCDTGMNQGGGATGGAPEGGAPQGGSPVGGGLVGGDGPIGGAPVAGSAPNGGGGGAGASGAGNQGGGSAGDGEGDGDGCDCTTAPRRESSSSVALLFALVALARTSRSSNRRTTRLSSDPGRLDRRHL